MKSNQYYPASLKANTEVENNITRLVNYDVAIKNNLIVVKNSRGQWKEQPVDYLLLLFFFLIRIIISFDGFNGLQGTVQQREVVKHVKKEKYFKPFHSSNKKAKDLKT